MLDEDLSRRLMNESKRRNNQMRAETTKKNFSPKQIMKHSTEVMRPRCSFVVRHDNQLLVLRAAKLKNGQFSTLLTSH